MRPIDADALEMVPDENNVMNGVRFMGRNCGKTIEIVRAALRKMIGNAPTIEAEPIRHGRWKFEFELADSNFYRCSECNRQEVLLAKEDVHEYFPYCHCGAKMDLEEEE